MIIGRSRKGEDEKGGEGASGHSDGAEREGIGGKGEGRGGGISDGLDLGLKDGGVESFRDKFEEEEEGRVDEEEEEEEGEGSHGRIRKK